MAEAPFFHDVSDAAPAETRWIRTTDGVRLRAAAWAGGAEGTVLLFSGRTEYIEKYSRIAAWFEARGMAAVTLDWRGQGLSDRALPDALTGHVADFRDYQHDVDALVAYAESLGLPRPFHLLAHSMGGAIALRSLHRGIGVEAVAFSSPMWGIMMTPMQRPLAWGVSWVGRALGRGDRYIPYHPPAPYIGATAYGANQLTGDAATFAWMQRQTSVHPELALGGPSVSWLITALQEMRSLRTLPPPPCPAIAFVGTDEMIVDPVPIRSVMRRWPGGRLDIVEGARHEILMEAPAVRDRFLEASLAHFARSRRSRAA